MLSYLHVKNLALIDEVEVEFGPGLNILTGETGAGKSILMGSVNLALGQKVSREMIRNPKDPALVELVFQVDNPRCVEALRERDILPEDGQVIISRKLTGSRNISRLNGEICTAAQIREISSLLLDIHGQHEHQSLLYQEHQLGILDAYGKDLVEEKREEVRVQHQIWMGLKKELSACQMDEETRKREIAFLEFVVQEIEEAGLVLGEDTELENRYRKISNSKKILESLAAVKNLTGYETGAGESVGRALQELGRVDGLDEQLSQLSRMLADVEGLLDDFNREVDSYVEDMSFSDEEFYEMDQRLNVLNHLKSKYGASIEAVLSYQEEKQKELDTLYHYEEHRKKLEKQTAEAEKLLEERCESLSQERKKCAGKLAEAVRDGLQDLNFLNVVFDIVFERTKNFTANGYDKIEFQISTNPGEPVRPLAKVVSGGELSRIMLAIKTILADKDETETLIFDEIDTGISGRTAQKVSEKMAVIGRNHQVLCITHLPQIAAMADTHFEIVKKVENGETTTRIHPLSEEASVEELARILGGAEITGHTLASAREMKDLAQKQKNTSVK
ncbi:MAG: DNA repair protein RecN [Clostridiales bacterium]|nr:DNA repair protein RecN [Clostridiales bacterium]